MILAVTMIMMPIIVIIIIIISVYYLLILSLLLCSTNNTSTNNTSNHLLVPDQVGGPGRVMDIHAHIHLHIYIYIYIMYIYTYDHTYVMDIHDIYTYVPNLLVHNVSTEGSRLRGGAGVLRQGVVGLLLGA